MAETINRGPKPVYSCSRCSYTTSHGAFYRRHIQDHEKPEIIECPFCPYTIAYSDKRLFRNHLFGHLEESLHCSRCDFSSKSLESYKRHVFTHTNTFSCAHCNFTTKHSISLREHVAKHEADAQPEAEVRCAACGSKMVSKNHYRRHLSEKHPDGTDMPCSKCNYVTKKIRNFKRHMLITHSVATV